RARALRHPDGPDAWRLAAARRLQPGRGGVGRALELAQPRAVRLAAVAALAVELQPRASVAGLCLQALELVVIGSGRQLACGCLGRFFIAWRSVCRRRVAASAASAARSSRPRAYAASLAFSMRCLAARKAASPRSGSLGCWLMWLLICPR